MQLRNKTSYEEFPIYLNFKNDLASDETVSSITTSSINTETNVASSIIASSAFTAAGRVTLNLDAGANNEEHKLTVSVTTSFGQIYEQEVYIVVDDEMDNGRFDIQPNEGILASFDFENAFAGVSQTINTTTVEAFKASDNSDVTATVIKGNSISGTQVIFKVDDCTGNEVYKVEVKIVTSTGNKYQRNIFVSCKER